MWDGEGGGNEGIGLGGNGYERLDGWKGDVQSNG